MTQSPGKSECQSCVWANVPDALRMCLLSVSLMTARAPEGTGKTLWWLWQIHDGEEFEKAQCVLQLLLIHCYFPAWLCPARPPGAGIMWIKESSPALAAHRNSLQIWDYQSPFSAKGSAWTSCTSVAWQEHFQDVTNSHSGLLCPVSAQGTEGRDFLHLLPTFDFLVNVFRHIYALVHTGQWNSTAFFRQWSFKFLSAGWATHQITESMI